MKSKTYQVLHAKTDEELAQEAQRVAQEAQCVAATVSKVHNNIKLKYEDFQVLCQFSKLPPPKYTGYLWWRQSFCPECDRPIEVLPASWRHLFAACSCGWCWACEHYCGDL